MTAIHSQSYQGHTPDPGDVGELLHEGTSGPAGPFFNPPFFGGGELPDLSRGQILLIAKGEVLPEQKLQEVLGRLGIAATDPEDRAFIDALVRQAAEAAEAEEWLRDSSSYDPPALAAMRERTAPANDSPLLKFVKSIVTEYHNETNMRLEFMARWLVQKEVEMHS